MTRDTLAQTYYIVFRNCVDVVTDGSEVYKRVEDLPHVLKEAFFIASTDCPGLTNMLQTI